MFAKLVRRPAELDPDIARIERFQRKGFR